MIGRTLLPFLLIAALLLGFSCGEKFDEHEDPSLDEIIRIGKDYLMTNQGAQAAEAFKAARERCVESTDANFGLILAHTMQLINLVDEVVALAGSLFMTAPPEPEAGDPEPIIMAQSTPIGDYIQEYLRDTIEKDFAENEMLFWEVDEVDSFNFDLPYYQIILEDQAYLTLGEQFDKTEFYFFGGTTGLVNALVDIIQAHDLNFDMNALAIPTLTDADLMTTLVAVADLLEGLLTDPEFPGFLLVKEDDGKERLKSAGINLGLAFDRLATMFDELFQETDNQFDDPIRYYDMNKNNRYDPRIDPVLVSDVLTLWPQMAPALRDLCVNLSYAFWEGSTLDPHPYKRDKLNLGMFNEILIQAGVLRNPLLPEWIGINVGSFFSNPSDDGLRSLLLGLIDIINLAAELTEPVEE